MSINKQIWPISTTTKDDAVSIGGCDLRVLAEEFSTPLFVLDEKDLISRAHSWKSALEDSFRERAGTVYYAAKAFISVEVAKLINAAGLGLDVCTGGELAVARQAGFPSDRIEMHGNNKSEVEIRAAIEYRVGTIVIDSFIEIERVAAIASEMGVRQKVLIRLTPGVEAHTHDWIATAHEDVKFGFSIASGSAWRAVEAVRVHSSLELVGVHAHIGSQIFGAEGFSQSAERLLEFLARYAREYGAELAELDLGGGYGIAYVDGDNPRSGHQVLSELAELIAKECARLSISIPLISIEPGRAIIGPSMVTLYRVGTTKEVVLEDGSNRRYISVDGGMSDNIRPALYGAEYSIGLVNRVSQSKVTASRIVGKHCETGDILILDVELPSDIEPGDLLAIPATGAYTRSMASNYNHVPRPAVISVLDGTARTIVRRETESDLLALDVVEQPRKISDWSSR